MKLQSNGLLSFLPHILGLLFLVYGTASVGSLIIFERVLWLLNPFAGSLLLLSSPFFFAMGVATVYKRTGALSNEHLVSAALLSFILLFIALSFLLFDSLDKFYIVLVVLSPTILLTGLLWIKGIRTQMRLSSEENIDLHICNH